MKINIGKLLKGAAKVAAPVVVTILASKAQRAVDKQAEKLIRKTDKL